MPRKNWNTTAAQRRASFRRFGKYAGNFALGTAEAVLKLAAGMNTEKKAYDDGAVPTQQGITPDINCVSGVPQGTAIDERIGNSIKATSFDFRGYIDWKAYEATSVSMLRIIIFRDLDKNAGVTPTTQQLLHVQATPVGMELMRAFNNLNNGKRFQILMDKVYRPNSIADTQVINFHYNFNTITKQTKTMSRKTDPHMTFSGVLTSDTNAGHIYIWVCSNTDEHKPVLAYLTRLRFIDN